jgi:hypothetical protein
MRVNQRRDPMRAIVESASPWRAGNPAGSRLFRRLSRLESQLRPRLAAQLLLVFIIFAAPKNNR